MQRLKLTSWGVFFVVACACAAGRSETVRTIDDKTTSGTIKGIEHGELLLQGKPGDPVVIRIPLAEIVEIKLHPLTAKPRTGPQQPVAAQPSNSVFGAIGNLLGLSSARPSPYDPAIIESSDQPPGDDDTDPSAPTNPQPAEGSGPYGSAYTPSTAAVPTAVAPSTEAPTPQVAPAIEAPSAPSTAATDPFGASPPAAASGTVGPPTPDPSPSMPTPASRHPGVPSWRVEFAGGDHFLAVLNGWNGKNVKLTLDSVVPSDLPPDVLEVAEDKLLAIWSANAALVKQAQDLKPSAAGQDVAYVEKDGQVKAVAGVVAGIDGEYLKFKFEGEERKIKLQRLVGVTLAQRETAPEKSPYQAYMLVNGDVLSGRIDAIEHEALLVKPLASSGAAARAIQIPLAQLATIEFKNGRLTWLGDLQPAGVVQVPYFDRLMPYRVNQSLTGGQLTLADGPISKGIAVHSKCALTYDIGGSFERFRAKVGFQQPEGKAGRAPVRIIGDGKTLWETTDLKGDASHPAAVDLDVAGVKTLTLEADYGPNQDVAGRVVWGEARLIKATAKP